MDRTKVEKELEREVQSTESESSDDSRLVSTEPNYGMQLRPPKYKLPERMDNGNSREFLRPEYQDK